MIPEFFMNKISITTHDKQEAKDRTFWLSQTPEARLDEVERLRLEAGKFLYEYPTRLQRVISVTRKKDLIQNKQRTQRTKDKADVEELTGQND